MSVFNRTCIAASHALSFDSLQYNKSINKSRIDKLSTEVETRGHSLMLACSCGEKSQNLRVAEGTKTGNEDWESGNEDWE